MLYTSYKPSGVGARNLQECLLLQLKHKTPTEYVNLATETENQFDAFTKKHYDKLLQKYSVSQEQLKKAIEEIEKLNPKPGGSFDGNSRMIEHVVPDFTIRIVDGELELSLNGRNAPSLHVSKDYQEMLQTYKDSRQIGVTKRCSTVYKTKIRFCQVVYRCYKTASRNLVCNNECHNALSRRIFS